MVFLFTNIVNSNLFKNVNDNIQLEFNISLQFNFEDQKCCIPLYLDILNN